MSDPQQYKWCKIPFQPTEEGAQSYYFQHFDTQEKIWEEPNEPYWLWDASTQNVHTSGLQMPGTAKRKPSNLALDTQMGLPTSTEPHSDGKEPATNEPDPDYQGYNPKIHGSYDPTAPYAKFHEQKRVEETMSQGGAMAAQTGPIPSYDSMGNFNRFTGGFQTADQSTERHNDQNKSARQLNAYFDVDGAANQYDGRSLKEERRSQKLSKKEIKELTSKRRERKEKKRLDFYKS